MRWSFLHCLFVVLLTGVVFDGVVARPIPNDLYRRTSTGVSRASSSSAASCHDVFSTHVRLPGGSPSPPHTPAPHTPAPHTPAPHAPGKQPQSPSHQTPSKIPVAVHTPGKQPQTPSHQTPSKIPVAVQSHGSYNLRPRLPKPPQTGVSLGWSPMIVSEIAYACLITHSCARETSGTASQ